MLKNYAASLMLAGDLLNAAFFSLTFTGPVFLLFLRTEA